MAQRRRRGARLPVRRGAGSRTARRGNPAVVLLDLKMPQGRRPRGAAPDPRGPGAEAHSGGDPHLVARGAGHDHAGYDLGVNAYVVKPMNFGSFVAVVKQLGAFWAILNEPPADSKVLVVPSAHACRVKPAHFFERGGDLCVATTTGRSICTKSPKSATRLAFGISSTARWAMTRRSPRLRLCSERPATSRDPPCSRSCPGLHWIGPMERAVTQPDELCGVRLLELRVTGLGKAQALPGTLAASLVNRD